MSEEESNPPLGPYPQKDARSTGYHIARTALDAGAAATLIPGAGYAIGQLVEKFVAEPLQKRRDDWFTQVGEGLHDLQARLDGFDPSKLCENDDFISAVAEATQAAIKTASQAKLEALRNGVMNIASGMRLDEVLRGTFFSYVERFSPAHISVLSILANPSGNRAMVEQASRMGMGAQWAILRAALPADIMPDSVLNRVLADLGREGLLDASGLKVMGTSGVFLAKRTTGEGDAFLQFISSPI